MAWMTPSWLDLLIIIYCFYRIAMILLWGLRNNLPDNDRMQIIILSSNGKPSISKDNGKTWKNLSPGRFVNLEINRVVANKAGNTVMIHSSLSSKIELSKDSGNTWQAIPSNLPNVDKSAIFAVNNKFYYFAESLLSYHPSYLVHSDENVESWTRIETTIRPHYSDFAAGPDGRIYTIGNISKGLASLVNVSSDEGKTWHSYGPNIDTDYSHCDRSNFFINPGIQANILSAVCDSSHKGSIDLFIQVINEMNTWKKISFPEGRFSGVKNEGKNIYLLIVPTLNNSNQLAYLYISHDVGETWIKRTIKLSETTRATPLLLGVRGRTIYLALPGGDSHSPIYHKLAISNDDGDSWQDLGSPVSSIHTLTGNQSIRDLTFTDKEIYIATDAGLYSIGSPHNAI